MTDYFDEVMEVVLDAERLGSRRLSNGVHLVGHVPHVAPEAYYHVVYPPLADAHIATIEQQIQRRLPSELKDFYKRSNGMHLFAYAMAIDGLRRGNVRTGDGAWQPFGMDVPNVKERPKDAGGSFVFFGGYEWDGSTLGMSPDSPVVHRCAPQSARFINEWPSFGEMLVGEVRRLSALFDESGRKINEDTPTIPE
jgi:hypothetical protein